MAAAASRSGYGASGSTYARRAEAEESKIARSRTGAEASYVVRQNQRNGPSSFGDFTGNMRNF